MKIRSLLLGAGVALSTLLPTSAGAAGAATTAARAAHPARPDFPPLVLPEAQSRGQRAVDLLGTRLPEVARWYGKSPDEFRSLLLNDRTLRIDRRGRLFVEDALEAPLPTLPADQQSVLDGTLLPLDQTFALHSRPGAQRTIYLNFKGATLSGTAWNSGTTITALPFDLDGVPYTFSSAELQRIQGIWQRVAEDYAPFDVDVTTEAPAADALTRSAGSDQVFGTTVLVTNSNGVYACSCGGVAYVGVFDATGDYYKPALVFYNQLGSGNEKYVAEAISHEAGHNVGLGHDGYSGGSYYGGHGSGATGWAPIMGVGYYRSLVQWSKGEYGTATNTQDDYVVMQANGLPIRADDHGGTVGGATALAGVAGGGVTTFTATGVIERPGDTDLFGFVAAAGTVTVGLAPAARAPNLDAEVQLLDAAGSVLASANPGDALAATLSVTVATTGAYYVGVRGVGKGDPLATGYTDYGSLGNYVLQVSAPSTGAQPPVAALTATPTSGTAPLDVAFSAAGSSDADGSIVAYDWDFGDGSGASGPATSHLYTAAGTFTAVLRVTDDTGLTASRSVTVSVDAPVTLVPMHVGDIAMRLNPGSRNRASADAAVRVVDGSGAGVAGVTVAGRWSGLVKGSVSGTTGSDGVVTFRSGTSSKSGTFTFAVTGASRTGYDYRSELNVETSDSISR